MNFGQIKARVLDDVKRTDQNLVSMVSDGINAAKLKIMRRSNFRGMEAESVSFIYPANSSGITLASIPITDLKEPIDLLLVDGNGNVTPLVKTSATQWRDELVATQGPSNYCGPCPPNNPPFGQFIPHTAWRLRWLLEQDNIGIVPSPLSSDLTLILKYYKFLPDYVNDNDTDYFSQRAWDILEEGALRQVYQKLGEPEVAALHEQDFRKMLADLISEERYAMVAGQRTTKGG